MRSKQARPSALTVAGSDSGGGAGIQADLRTFAQHGVHGLTALTCVTAQNPRGVSGIQALRPAMVRAQIEAVWEDFQPAAAKTGMLFSSAIIREVTSFIESAGRAPWVVDPVMVATSGAPLLEAAAMRALKQRLLPRATLITPNLDEMQILSDVRIRGLEELREAARVVCRRFGCAVLAKGGHLSGPAAVDVLWDGASEVILKVSRVKVASTHGTGCTYSAAVAAGLAQGLDLRRAVESAKTHVTNAIRQSGRVGRHWVLGGAGEFSG